MRTTKSNSAYTVRNFKINRLKADGSENLFTLLNLDIYSDPALITTAYRETQRIFHVDKFSASSRRFSDLVPEDVEEFKNIGKAISEAKIAYDTDPERYIENIRNQRSQNISYLQAEQHNAVAQLTKEQFSSKLLRFLIQYLIPHKYQIIKISGQYSSVSNGIITFDRNQTKTLTENELNELITLLNFSFELFRAQSIATKFAANMLEINQLDKINSRLKDLPSNKLDKRQSELKTLIAYQQFFNFLITTAEYQSSNTEITLVIRRNKRRFPISDELIPGIKITNPNPALAHLVQDLFQSSTEFIPVTQLQKYNPEIKTSTRDSNYRNNTVINTGYFLGNPTIIQEFLQYKAPILIQDIKNTLKADNADNLVKIFVNLSNNWEIDLITIYPDILLHAFGIPLPNEERQQIAAKEIVAFLYTNYNKQLHQEYIASNGRHITQFIEICCKVNIHELASKDLDKILFGRHKIDSLNNNNYGYNVLDYILDDIVLTLTTKPYNQVTKAYVNMQWNRINFFIDKGARFSSAAKISEIINSLKNPDNDVAPYITEFLNKLQECLTPTLADELDDILNEFITQKPKPLIEEDPDQEFAFPGADEDEILEIAESDLALLNAQYEAELERASNDGTDNMVEEKQEKTNILGNLSPSIPFDQNAPANIAVLRPCLRQQGAYYQKIIKEDDTTAEKLKSQYKEIYIVPGQNQTRIRTRTRAWSTDSIYAMTEEAIKHAHNKISDKLKHNELPLEEHNLFLNAVIRFAQQNKSVSNSKLETWLAFCQESEQTNQFATRAFFHIAIEFAREYQINTKKFGLLTGRQDNEEIGRTLTQDKGLTGAKLKNIPLAWSDIISPTNSTNIVSTAGIAG